MNLKQIKSVVNTYKGATLDQSLNQATVNSGYMVSLKDHELKTSTKSLTSEVLKEYKKLAKHNDAYVGFWLDNEDLYIDVSINIQDRKKAIKIAQENKQLAIYDCRNGVSIYV